MPDHVHMMISILPKILGGAGHRIHVGQHFWARGYFVSTVGRDEAVIRSYIRHREIEDQRVEQLKLA